ncbi:MAG: hypothetical protein Q4B54_09420 [Coriobacteriales bacterium]|nr:hypothetical protein [Coriobacteriales bacterium]
MGRIKRLAIGAAAITVVSVAGTVIVIKSIRKWRQRKKTVLANNVRAAMTDLLKLRSEDFLARDGVGQSLFMQHVNSLDDKKLIALFALVQVGHFVRTEHIDVLHPNAAQIAEAARHYLQYELNAPTGREEIVHRLQEEGPGNLKDALSAGLSIVSQA